MGSSFSNLFDSTTIPVLEQVANFAQTRHTVLAANIANLDTPGYLVRDVSPEDFRRRLAEAIEARDQPPPSETPEEPFRLRGVGSPGEPPYWEQTGESGKEEQPGDMLAKVSKNPELILHHDGSNVSIERQVSEMAKNQMEHNLALTIMRHQFQLLQTAISERM